MAQDVKPPDPVLDPNKSAPADVKPPVDKSKSLDVKPDGSPAPDVKPTPQAEPGDKTDSAQLLKSLQDERDRRRAAEARNEQFKQVAGDKLQFDANGNPIAPATPQENMQAKIDELWETDPKQAVRTEMMMGFQWYDKVATSLDTQRADLRTKYPDFNKYENQSLSYVRTLPLDQRSKPGVVELAYLVQKGQDTQSIYQQATEDVIRKIRAGESVQGLTATQSETVTPTGTQPTDDQMKTAEAMNVPIAEYMKNVKR